MKTLIITAGHTIKSGQGTGAKSIYGDEAVEARKLVSELSKDLNKRYSITVYTDSDNWSLKDTIAWIGKTIKSAQYNIDIHFNASANPAATGCEVLIANQHNQKEFILASNISSIISGTLKIKDRGVKTEADSQHKKLGILSDSRLAAANNILIEICFISNPNDMKTYKDNFNKLVTSLSDTINEFIK